LTTTASSFLILSLSGFFITILLKYRVGYNCSV
jgi:hypothetical protein